MDELLDAKKIEAWRFVTTATLHGALPFLLCDAMYSATASGNSDGLSIGVVDVERGPPTLKER